MPPPDLVPDFSKTMRLLSANVVIGFTAGPLILVAWLGAVTYSYDSSRRSLREILSMIETLLVHFGDRWALISTFFCILIWLPIWLTQSFHFVFRKWSYAAFTGMLLGLIAFTLTKGAPADTAGTALAGAISGIGIFLLSYLFRERPDPTLDRHEMNID